jgi:hypothetical protein
MHRPALLAPGQATLTRSASTYQALELTLLQAVDDRNRVQLGRILSEEFEVWSAERVGPLSRRDWEAASFAAPPGPSRIRELTVREFGDVAVVSFLLDTGPPGRSSSTIFVVDVWAESTRTLRVRYESTPAHPATGDRRRE